VFHQQGERFYKEPYSVDKSKIKWLLRKQKELAKQIPFVPLTISYEDRTKFRSRLDIEVGDPIRVPDNGIEKLTEYLLAQTKVKYS
jgi:hypothetical protein